MCRNSCGKEKIKMLKILLIFSLLLLLTIPNYTFAEDISSSQIVIRVFVCNDGSLFIDQKGTSPKECKNGEIMNPASFAEKHYPIIEKRPKKDPIIFAELGDGELIFIGKW